MSGLTFTTTIMQAFNRGDVVNKIVSDLPQHGDKGRKYTKGRIAMKINNWIHLDNFVPEDDSSMDARMKVLQSHSKWPEKHRTMRQHRHLNCLIRLVSFMSSRIYIYI